MSKDPRQQQHRFSARFWLFVFKAIVAIGQVANLVSKIISMRE